MIKKSASKIILLSVLVTSLTLLSQCRLPEGIDNQFGEWMYFDGWSSIDPSPDSRIAYVSSGGNDATAVVYFPGDPEIGANPRDPAGTVLEFATYDAAAAVMREGYPDWILFKRGEVFEASLEPTSGRSASEVSLIGAYGDSASLPTIVPKTNTDTSRMPVIDVFGFRDRSWRYSVIQSIDFYSVDRDPAISNPVPEIESIGFNLIAGGVGDSKGTISHILIEGCRFRFFEVNILQALDDGMVSNIMIRRSSFLDNYVYNESVSHSQGFYAEAVRGFHVSENYFDHNGWLNQAPGTPGTATMFNHNIYIADSHGVELSRNISIRPSSIHFKLTANRGEGSGSSIRIVDNLFVDGEVGVSIGGNSRLVDRFRSCEVRNNVFLNIGLSQPTNRTLGWGLDIVDWDGGVAADNLFLHNTNPMVTAARGIYVNGASKDVSISNNIVYGIEGDAFVIDVRNAFLRDDVRVMGNRFQGGGNDGVIMRIPSQHGLLVASNHYDSTASNPFVLEGVPMDSEEWATATDDDSIVAPMVFADAGRNIERYQSEVIGGTGTLDAFIAACRSQGRFDWDDRYSADAVLPWIRSGF